ncbi:Rhodanese-like domain-containing protein [Bombardia bombarda]|uniref:Rhodanese-like domain-containing protein n=1 Tax=Bombardia bombarda TaxID=252184 RepID=A0AA40C9G5_9PEZI|nr:Rhodanese-like domain-containing protein [Bombardia bombarda]
MAPTDEPKNEPQFPWHAAYPAPKSEAVTISREEVLQMMKRSSGKGQDEQGAKMDFVLVDLRRNDFEGGTIRGSINLPAQSLHPTLPTVYSMFKSAGVRQVIWYCGSSRGRGSRAAGWLADYLQTVGDTTMKSLALLEGVRGWASAGEQYVEWMDEYDEAAWSKSG